jgi:serine/threonine-protein kinase RsbT
VSGLLTAGEPSALAGQVVPVTTLVDAGRARRAARRLAEQLGFPAEAAEAVALATSELATNLARYARSGVIVLRAVLEPERRGVQVESRDAGPGIADLDRALQDGFSSGGGLGGGLGGARRLMDEFEVSSGPAGTRIVACKWLPAAPRPPGKDVSHAK